MIDGKDVLGALGIIAADYVLSKDGFPPMRTIVMPVECDENDLVLLDVIHSELLFTRLSMDMLIYAWGVVTKSMSDKELEKAKAKIEETLKRIDEVDKELKRIGIELIPRPITKWPTLLSANHPNRTLTIL